MRGSLGAPRILLRKLRELMAEPINPQERLDKIVEQIATNVVAEVCSVYVLRDDNVLELAATVGLKREAVHQTSLKVGEGLVGLIASEARCLNLPNAQSHPAFAYKPETGEEMFNAFLGVPILRAGRILGVLVVQNKAHRTYQEDEVEILQTTAMIIAEMIAAGGLERLLKPGSSLDVKRPMQLKGVGLGEGVGLGHVVLHEPRIVVSALIADDVPREANRLDTAIEKLRLSVDALLSRSELDQVGEHRDVLEAYRMFAYDRGWVRKMEEAVKNGLTAEAAVEKVQSDTRARMLRQTDPYLRERLHDFDALANRLIRELMGRPHGPMAGELPKDAVIVARNMGAADLFDYDRDRIKGLVLEEGAPTSHISIVARSMGIPVVGQVEGVVSLVETGDSIIVDGESGAVHLRPAPDVESAFAEKVRFRARKQAQYRRLKSRPSITKDGHHVQLLLNSGLFLDLPHLEESGASGIGLFRTELQFMVATAFPRIGEQEALYARVLESAGGKPVTFRSLDIGGDKVLPYAQRLEEEENPAMGWRAIRIGLDRPGLLRIQVRALLKAAAGRELRLMFPMVADISEFERAQALVEREKNFLKRLDYELPETIKLGVMIEVPSLLFQLDELFGKVHFASVGSNDLFQFAYASDRGNTRMTGRYDAMSLSFLRVLKLIQDKANEHHVPLTLCGELSGRPLEAMALIALGYRSLSMSSSSVGPVKTMLLELDVAKLRARLLPRLEPGRPNEDIRAMLRTFAEEQGVPVQP
ncbi:phosphoenolpyruvate--protein phosphotransferase [Pinisolibacter aquiterrae]|uniref:phosphoenolpyruvate--protein phosphotransferase n=1 Tax=Pinisolibacter aquiterrae TaxID=2815579 RepID=UPI001C3E3BD8|nr:phosphoenolpyruvate--protein phosphotransferase [Pinisolibacter aquiterrae]MBV5262885.1 phosphoenolpyruvate--protein phosphotransferase [Pinisolibacter aquiterrae]MCC8236400.1 phosphoenolpyruvate--protein phosphotransferase [Pinisolibacter aquiterrae]